MGLNGKRLTNAGGIAGGGISDLGKYKVECFLSNMKCMGAIISSEGQRIRQGPITINYTRHYILSREIMMGRGGERCQKNLQVIHK